MRTRFLSFLFSINEKSPAASIYIERALGAVIHYRRYNSYWGKTTNEEETPEESSVLLLGNRGFALGGGPEQRFGQFVKLLFLLFST